jgi:hypothetical protein
MLTFKHGTPRVGQEGSYQFILHGLKDALKGKPKSYEIFHIGERLKQTGLDIGLTQERIQSDWNEAHKEAKQ